MRWKHTGRVQAKPATVPTALGALHVLCTLHTRSSLSIVLLDRIVICTE